LQGWFEAVTPLTEVCLEPGQTYGCDGNKCGCLDSDDDYKGPGGWLQVPASIVMQNELPIVHCDDMFKLKFFKPDQAYYAA
jgi:hypothetical protein